MRSMAAIEGCQYDLLVIGHSIPTADQEAMVQRSRERCDAPILALVRLGALGIKGVTGDN